MRKDPDPDADLARLTCYLSPEQIRDEIRREAAAVSRKCRRFKPTGKPHRLGVVLSDVHVPKHDPASWAVALKAVRDLRPDHVWILGDFLDLASVNRHEKAPGDDYTLRQELWCGNRALDEVADAIGPRPCDLLFVDGNHEDRMRRYVASGRCPPELRDALEEVPDALCLKQRGWRYVGPDEQPIYDGSLAVFHGHWYGKHHAAKHLDEMGGSVIYGHTHRPQQMTRQTVRGPIIGTGAPCLRRLSAEWQHQRNREFTGWLNGFVVLEWIDGYCHPRNVFVVNECASYGGRVWRAAK